MDRKNKSPIRVMVVEDFLLVRAGIRSLLEKLSFIVIVAEAGDGREALRLIEAERPDVVLIKALLPELNGTEVAAQVRARFDKIAVLILAMHGDEQLVLQALRAGASGYLTYSSSPDELKRAIAEVASGRVFLSPAISRHVVSAYLQGDMNATSVDRLTPRQREILQMVAEGNTSKEIARKLTLSIKTVEGHRAQIMKTLDIRDLAGLVRYAIRMGLVSASS